MPKEMENEIRKEWRQAQVQDNYCDNEGNLYGDEIADWWLDKLNTALLTQRQELAGEIEKLEIQKFLDKRCDVADFIKLSDAVGIINKE